ncbi:MAG: hypothetical protein A2Z30_02940 [Chloroflexi bacterium RBG_16_64_43]|nr:MAG: hypothetical protein A2Z30_02940 [Chloroflexi bacterium RBG_16_64_43]
MMRLSKRSRNRQPGQALILIAMAFIGLLAFVGLAIDGGQFFIGMGNLRRATDAASLAAAAQVREGRLINSPEVINSALQVLRMNGVDTGGVDVLGCLPLDIPHHDASLCTTPPRKLVRVRATSSVPMAFLPVIGINVIPIIADSVAEAASLDVVLAIDVSESMAYDRSCSDGDDDDADGVADDCNGRGGSAAQNGAFPDDFMRDPSQCNPGNDCHPFAEVKFAASHAPGTLGPSDLGGFVQRILDKAPADEEDRLAIVYFSNGFQGAPLGSHVVTPPGWAVGDPLWFNSQADAAAAINNLIIYNPDVCPDPLGAGEGPCRKYDAAGDYDGFECPMFRDAAQDPRSCTTTNIGGGLLLAGQMFNDHPKEEALWVTVLLTDGAANASSRDMPTHPYGYCPGSAGAPDWVNPFCRDNRVITRHTTASGLYDADDYARDMADYVGCTPTSPAAGCSRPGQGAVAFAIGLGGQVLAADSLGVAYGASLLRYVAAVGDDFDPGTDLCASVPDPRTWCGNYYFSPTGAQLNRIFEDVASRIFTRITQ